jgi:hypothetical protein
METPPDEADLYAFGDRPDRTTWGRNYDAERVAGDDLWRLRPKNRSSMPGPTR